MTTPPRVRIMLEGISLTDGKRNVSYGDPMLNLTAAGALKQTMRSHIHRTDLPLGTLEAIDQVLTKVARIITGNFTPDNYVDGATYFAIGGEIDERSRPKPPEEQMQEYEQEQEKGQYPETGVSEVESQALQSVAEALEDNRTKSARRTANN